MPAKERLLSVLAVSVAMLLSSVPPQVFAASFADVSSSDPDRAAIIEAQERGIMTGLGDGRFEPDRPVTRAELAKIAAKANSIEIVDIDAAPFPDMPVTHSLAREVAAIKQRNQFFTNSGYGARSVLSGYPDGTFRPQATASAAEASKIMLGSALFEPGEGRAYFVQKDFSGYQSTSLSDYYNHAAKLDLFRRPISWYAAHGNAPMLRRDVARVLASIQDWYDVAPHTPDLFQCKPGSEWEDRIQQNAMWSADKERSGEYSQLCVSPQMGTGYNIFTSSFNGYSQVYTFRTSDRTEQPGFDGQAIGGVHMSSSLPGTHCVLDAAQTAKSVLFHCEGADDEYAFDLLKGGYGRFSE